MTPDGRREATLKIDVIVEVIVASIEGRFDEGVMVSVGADLGCPLIWRDAYVQLWASVRQCGNPEVLARTDCSSRELKIRVSTIFTAVFVWPIGADVVRHVVPVEYPEAHWVCCVCSWLTTNVIFRFFFDGDIRSLG